MLKKKDKIKVIYILAAGHSGSTLLDMLLSSHSKIFGCGELINISNDIFTKSKSKKKCTCGKSSIDCNFWKNFYSIINSHTKYNLINLRQKYNIFNLLINNKNNALLPNKKIDVKSYVEMNSDIYFSISHVSGQNVLVDSSKNNFQLILNMSKNPNIDFILIHLVRDARGYYYSYKRKYGRVIYAIYLWLKSNIYADFLSHKNKNHLCIKYEELVENPEKILSQILNLINLNYEKSMLNFRNSNQHQIEGNRMRFSNNNKLVLDDKWKSNQTFFDKVLYYICLFWLNKKYKY